jgi:hypothetical protein
MTFISYLGGHMARLCAHCGRPLPLSTKNPNQKYCGQPECQKARKRLWQKQKMASDPAYRENQRHANNEWLKNNPHYWDQYRQSRPEYTKRNREMSKERMRIRRQVISLVHMFAKMDASIVDTTRLSGYYGLIPLGEMFAKMDAKIVKINICREDTAYPGHVCKERTVSPTMQ